MEILPGIHHIESDLGARFMCQYLLIGEDRTVLVDTGLARTPEEVIIPYLEELGLRLEDVDEVIVSHADLDHCGGNRTLKERHPSLRFSCGEADRPYVENGRVMLAEIYGWSEPYGFGPDEAAKASILEDLGGDSSVDVGMHGGETLRLGPGWRVEILHLPGHTPGHLGIWDPKNRAAIIIDAVLERGIYDREGNRLIPRATSTLPSTRARSANSWRCARSTSSPPTTCRCRIRMPSTSSIVRSTSRSRSTAW